MAPDSEQVAGLVDLLRQAGQTVATAESLTGGLVCATLVDVPGASTVVRGGVVAYAADVKRDVLGVDPGLLEREGTVHPQVAAQLAAGARDVLAATWGLGTTGVAGPGPAEGHPAGTVHVAVCGPDGTTVQSLLLAGDRAAVRSGAARAVLVELAARLGNSSDRPVVDVDVTSRGRTQDGERR